MPASRYVTPGEGWNQNKQRQVAIAFDQHRSKEHPDGRAWWGYTETPADPTHKRGFVGELQPIVADLDLGEGTIIKGWDAPWIPESKYVQMATSMLTGNRFKLDYSRMISDYVAANERYYRLAASEAGARNWKAPKMYGPVEFQLRAIVGEPPKSPKVPEAALAGDPWLIGADHRPNEKIKKILDREQGRMRLELEEADDAEQYDAQPSPRAATTTNSNPLSGLSTADIADLTELLEQRRRMANARNAKKASNSQTSPTAA